MAETATLYEEDYYAWTRAQADALRRLGTERWNGPLDLEHLAEEVEDLGRANSRRCEARLSVSWSTCSSSSTYRPQTLAAGG